MSKFFLVNTDIESVGDKVITEIESRKSTILSDEGLRKEQKNKDILQEKDLLSWVKGRVIIKIDTQSKNSHTFSNGITIRRERQFNEFNRRITEPVNAYVISAENIPIASEILIGHNSLHDSNRIFNYKNASETSDIRYYSIPEGECFAWRDTKGELQPTKGFAFGLRVFEPYTGTFEGIIPTQIKDTLYITTGELKGKVVNTLKASDYQIIYQGLNGVEENILRCRHYENEINDREEIISISNSLTEKLNNTEFLIGIEDKDCKTLNEYYG